MRKILSVIFVFALLLPVLAACQSSPLEEQWGAQTQPSGVSPEGTLPTQGTGTPQEIQPQPGAASGESVPASTGELPSATDGEGAQTISREEAQQIALKHAGVTAEQVRFLETELDRDDGAVHYDVDFEKDGYDYDYEIDAKTGKILKAEKERD